MKNDTAEILLAFWWGLGGGFSHCIGMCGMFVFAYTGSMAAVGEMRPLGQLVRHLLFNLGHILTVTLLGGLAGLVGSLPAFALRWKGVQGWVSVIAGVLMILLALGYLGAAPKLKFPEPNVLGGNSPLKGLFLKAMRTQSPWKPFFLGGLIGFLPCGLIYTVLIPAAATGSLLKGMAVMAAFGTGTMPGLVALGLFSSLATMRFRDLIVRLASIPVLIMGILFIQRGWPYLGWS